MCEFGLIGKDIGYSFSKTFFLEKFKKENLPFQYENFDLPSIDFFPNIISENPALRGLNVTIPYKEEVMPYLNEIDMVARKIGAVNTIKISDNNKLIGHNTDHYGFNRALEKFLPLPHKTALVLGTGGASNAVVFILKKLGFSYTFVSRSPDFGSIAYEALNENLMRKHSLIVNCTPLGTYPNIHQSPDIPYQHITAQHLLFDLIYNPTETEFLRQGKMRGAKTANGLKMLEMQAEKSWEIWNS